MWGIAIELINKSSTLHFYLRVRTLAFCAIGIDAYQISFTFLRIFVCFFCARFIQFIYKWKCTFLIDIIREWIEFKLPIYNICSDSYFYRYMPYYTIWYNVVVRDSYSKRLYSEQRGTTILFGFRYNSEFIEYRLIQCLCVSISVYRKLSKINVILFLW